MVGEWGRLCFAGLEGQETHGLEARATHDANAPVAMAVLIDSMSGPGGRSPERRGTRARTLA